jgi:hypothetical protein
MDDGKYGKNVTTSQNWKKKTHTHTHTEFSYKHKFHRKTRGSRFALETRETVDSMGCCKAQYNEGKKAVDRG